MIGGELVVLNKERPEQQVARVTTVIGDVENKIVVMTDDIIDTAGTLVAGADRAQGGRRGEGLRLRHARAVQRPGARAHRRERDRPTDRHRHGCRSIPSTKPDNVEVLTVAGILADTIRNVFADDSVSAIFAGENQLF